MPEFRDEFLVAFTESRFLIGPDQSAAVQEELRERRTGRGGKKKKKKFNFRFHWKEKERHASGGEEEEKATSPVGQGLKGCVHVARIPDVFHPSQACGQRDEAGSTESAI